MKIKMIESYFIREKENCPYLNKNERRGRKQERNCRKGHGLITGLRELSLENKDGKMYPFNNRNRCSSGSNCCQSFGKENSPCNFEGSRDDDSYLWEIYNSSDKPVKRAQKEKAFDSDISCDEANPGVKPNTVKTSKNESTSPKSYNRKTTDVKPRDKSLTDKAKLKSPSMRKINKYKVNNEYNSPLNARAIARKPFRLPGGSSPKEESFFKGITYHAKSAAKKEKDNYNVEPFSSKDRLRRHNSMIAPSTPKHTCSPIAKSAPKALTEPRGKRKSNFTKALFEPEMNMKPNKIARSDPCNLNNPRIFSGTSLFKPLQDISNFQDIGVSPIAEKQCISCNTRDTPIWREAEDGTELCNACGIRWKKHHIRCIRCWFIPARDEKNFDICPGCLSCGTIRKCNTLRRFSSSIY